MTTMATPTRTPMSSGDVATMFWEQQGRKAETRISNKQALWIMREWRREGGSGMRPDGYFAPNGEADRASMLYWTLVMAHNGSGRLVTRPLERNPE